jgi:glycosyltransferase involved in cell wall biosynthesis
MKLSVVIPAHDEADTIPELLRRLERVLETVDCEWELVLVDDGSRDPTWPLIKEAAESDPRIRGVRLSRNFGHQAALSAGLCMAEGDAVITMDADLQHPPELIPAILDRAGEGFDVIYAIRGPDDSEGWFKVHSAHFFYWLLNRLTRLDLPAGGADYRYMSRRAVNALLSMPERHRFLRGMARWIGFMQSTVEYTRAPRAGGRSKYGLRRMVHFAFDAILGFSALPLRIASVLGLVVSMLGGVYLVYVLAMRAFTATVVPGWTSVAAAVLLLGGVQLACLGILGQYIGRMYEELKGRPLFMVWEDTRRPNEPGLEHARATAPLTGELLRTSERTE